MLTTLAPLAGIYEGWDGLGLLQLGSRPLAHPYILYQVGDACGQVIVVLDIGHLTCLPKVVQLIQW